MTQVCFFGTPLLVAKPRGKLETKVLDGLKKDTSCLSRTRFPWLCPSFRGASSADIIEQSSRNCGVSQRNGQRHFGQTWAGGVPKEKYIASLGIERKAARALSGSSSILGTQICEAQSPHFPGLRSRNQCLGGSGIRSLGQGGGLVHISGG